MLIISRCQGSPGELSVFDELPCTWRDVNRRGKSRLGTAQLTWFSARLGPSVSARLVYLVSPRPVSAHLGRSRLISARGVARFHAHRFGRSSSMCVTSGILCGGGSAQISEHLAPVKRGSMGLCTFRLTFAGAPVQIPTLRQSATRLNAFHPANVRPRENPLQGCTRGVSSASGSAAS